MINVFSKVSSRRGLIFLLHSLILPLSFHLQIKTLRRSFSQSFHFCLIFLLLLLLSSSCLLLFPLYLTLSPPCLLSQLSPSSPLTVASFSPECFSPDTSEPQMRFYLQESLHKVTEFKDFILDISSFK